MKAPIYIKIDKYTEIVEIMRVIKNKVEEIKINLKKVEQIKNEQEAEINLWNSRIQEVEQKLREIDEMILSSE